MARQRELHTVADILARRAERVTKTANFTKVILILLGAFTATQGTADQLLGQSNATKIIAYTVAGLLIAALAGLEAAFKFDARAAELRLMAADCQSAIRAVDSQWQKEIGGGESYEPVEEARGLIDLQDAKLAEIQQRAAKSGVNITLEIRELYAHGDEDVNQRQPYNA